jgi:flagellar protein FlbD
VIILTKLSGERFALNPDLVQRVEASHDTVVTLVDGAKYLVAESLDVVADRMLDYRIAVVSGAQESVRLHLVPSSGADLNDEPDVDDEPQHPATPPVPLRRGL